LREWHVRFTTVTFKTFSDQVWIWYRPCFCFSKLFIFTCGFSLQKQFRNDQIETLFNPEKRRYSTLSIGNRACPKTLIFLSSNNFRYAWKKDSSNSSRSWENARGILWSSSSVHNTADTSQGYQKVKSTKWRTKRKNSFCVIIFITVIVIFIFIIKKVVRTFL